LRLRQNTKRIIGSQVKVVLHIGFCKGLFSTKKVRAVALSLVAPWHNFVVGCRNVGGRASTVARPRFGGRATVLARACARPCAADKRKAWRGEGMSLCDKNALSHVKKMLAFFVWEMVSP